jgi:hypothetical protein
MRGSVITVLFVALALSSGCLTEGFTWVPPMDASGIDAPPRDIDASLGHAPGAIEGTVSFPTSGGVPSLFAIRVWLYAVDPIASTDGGARWDAYSSAEWDAHRRDEARNEIDASDAAVVSDARGFAVPLEPSCPTEFMWPPDYRVDIEPAPNPASYRIDNVPAGTYCLVVVLDEQPYFAPGDPPACTDARTVPPIRVQILEGMTAAPPVVLEYPTRCRWVIDCAKSCESGLDKVCK